LPGLSYRPSASDTLRGAHALVVVTEWKEFRAADLDAVRRQLVEPVIFDGRNMFEPALARAAGLEYIGIGRPQLEIEVAHQPARVQPAPVL